MSDQHVDAGVTCARTSLVQTAANQVFCQLHWGGAADTVLKLLCPPALAEVTASFAAADRKIFAPAAVHDTGLILSSDCVAAAAIGWPLAWLFETAWLIVFPRATTLTFYLSAVLLFCGLGAIGWTAGRTHALTAAPAGTKPNQFIWVLFVLPTSMNAAWMSVASCLGLDVLAVSQGLPKENELALAATLAVIVAAIGAAIILLYRDVPWGLVLIWAFVAVLKAHPHLELIRTLAVIAIGVAGLCSGYVAVRYWQNRRSSWGESAEDRAAAGVQQPLLVEQQAPAGSSGVQALE